MTLRDEDRRFVKVSIRQHRHTKFRGIGGDAIALWHGGLQVSKDDGTDGFIARTVPAAVCAFAGITKVKQAIAALVRAGLWKEVEDGWQMYGYLDHQTSAADDAAKRAANSERVRKFRGQKPTTRNALQEPLRNAEHNASRTPSVTLPRRLDIDSSIDDNSRVLSERNANVTRYTSRQASPPPAPHGSSDQEKPNESPPDQPRPVVADVVADQDKRPPAPSSSDPGRAARWRLLDAIADAAVKRQRSLPEGVRNEDAYRSGVIAETLRESGALVDSVADAHQNASKPELLSRFNAALSRSHLSPKRLTALEAEEATGRANRARDEANAQAEAQQAAAAQQRRDAIARARAELGPERCEELRAKAEEELLAAGDPMARSGARSTLRAMRIDAATDELILAAVGERTAAEPDRSPNMTNPRRLQAVSA